MRDDNWDDFVLNLQRSEKEKRDKLEKAIKKKKDILSKNKTVKK